MKRAPDPGAGTPEARFKALRIDFAPQDQANWTTITPAQRRTLLQHQKNAVVRALLGRVDADPYRDAVRDAVLAGDEGGIRDLAAQDDALLQPPGFAAFLGETKVIDVERRQELLRAALSRRTTDVDLLMTLAFTSAYPAYHPKRLADQMRWLQAALAVPHRTCREQQQIAQEEQRKQWTDQAKCGACTTVLLAA